MNYIYPDNKFYWGHYLNLALHNVAATMQHITDACKLEDFKGKMTEDFLNLEGKDASATDSILNQFAEKLRGKPEIERRLKDLLLKHFTYLHYHQENDDTVSYAIFLKDVLEKFSLINHRRNFCSHAVHIELHTADFTNIKYQYAEITEARRKNLSSEILAKAKDNVIKNTVLYPKYGNDIEKRKNILAPLLGEAYQLFETTLDKEEKPTFAATDKGLAYMACLFLPRSDAYLFLNRLNGFQKTDFQRETENEDLANLQWQAAFDVFAHFYIKLPQPKLQSSDPKLDLFNEITRAPRALFNALTEYEQKNWFLRKSHDADDVENPDYDASLGGTWHKRGKDDRFPYFAMRYLEEKNALGDARFQVQLGRVQLGEAYKKQMLGEQQDRRLLKETMVFDKLATYLDRVQSRDPLLTDNDKLEATKHELFGEAAKYIEQFSPKYNMANNNVGIKFEPSDMNELKIRMAEWKSKTRGQKNTITAPADLPDAFLSVHELPNLVFYYHLYKEKHATTAPIEVIENYCKQFLAFYKAVQNDIIQPFTNEEGKTFFHKTHPTVFGGGVKGKKKASAEDWLWFEKHEKNVAFRTNIIQNKINAAGFDLIEIKNLPDALRDYLLGYTDDNVYHKAKDAIKVKRRETLRRKNDLEKNKEDAGNQKDLADCQPKVGDVAAWLAKDLVYFQPYQNETTNRGRPTDAQAVKLQAALSQFGSYKTQLWAFFKELRLVENTDKTLNHPFLTHCKTVVENYTGNIYDFYAAYLQARYDFLDDFMILEKTDKKDPKTNKWIWETVCTIKKPADLKKNEYWLKIKPSNALQKDYANEKTPMQLPRGLFNKAIAEALQNVAHCKDTVKVGDTMTHCVAKYVQGDTQPFYAIERVYNYKTKDAEKPTEMTTVALKALATELKSPKTRTIERNVFGTIIKTQESLKPSEDDHNEAKYIETLLRKNIAERDKTIRYAQTGDRIAFLMLKDWFSSDELTIDAKELTLHDCFLPPNKNEQINPFEREDFLSKKFEMKVAIGTKTIIANLPLYRYGEFRKILKDKRVGEQTDDNGNKIGLLAWYDAETIPLDHIFAELKYYNEHRHEVLEQILKLEEKMHTLLNHGGNYTDHSKYTKKLGQPPYSIAPEPLHIGLMLRNKFGHNSILHKPLLDRNKPTERLLEDIEALLGRLSDDDITKNKLKVKELIEYTKRIYENWIAM